MENQTIQIPSPEYVPPEFSSEEEMSDEEDSLPIQSHANIDLITFDSLNSNTVQKLIQERDRLEFGNLRKRHTLLRRINHAAASALQMVKPLRRRQRRMCSTIRSASEDSNGYLRRRGRSIGGAEEAIPSASLTTTHATLASSHVASLFGRALATVCDRSGVCLFL